MTIWTHLTKVLKLSKVNFIFFINDTLGGNIKKPPGCGNIPPPLKMKYFIFGYNCVGGGVIVLKISIVH